MSWLGGSGKALLVPAVLIDVIWVHILGQILHDFDGGVALLAVHVSHTVVLVVVPGGLAIESVPPKEVGVGVLSKVVLGVSKTVADLHALDVDEFQGIVFVMVQDVGGEVGDVDASVAFTSDIEFVSSVLAEAIEPRE